MSASQLLQKIRPGKTVAGRFRIVDVIGQGGFSVVFRAYQEGMQRYVALKVLKPEVSDDELVVERFRREALFASHLSHPNTITLFDYGRTEDGLCYIAMEYLVGTELGTVVAREEGLELERVWRILAQIAQSLAEAHRFELIHRDVKPDNIFLVERSDDELVKVLDFGLSKAFGTSAAGDSKKLTTLTQDGKVFGTPLYMAPEQGMNRELSAATDVYALGHIAYAMVTGAARYGDVSDSTSVMVRHIEDPPLELPEPYDETPFSKLLTECTRKDPRERISDAGELYEAMTRPEFADYMPAGPLRDRLSEREAAHRNWGSGLGSEASVVEEPGALSFDRELALLSDVLGEVRDHREMRLVLVNGPRGGGRTQLLERFLEGLRERDDLTVIHRGSFRGGEFEERGLPADIAQLQQRGDAAPVDEGVLPMISSNDEDETGEDLGSNDSAFFGNLQGKRETMFSKTGRLFRRRAAERPVVWALERLERLDTFSLAFLNWFFQDLQARPAPVLIVATVSRSALVDRSGLLRYTQAILGAAEPTVRRLFVAATERASLAVEHGLDQVSEGGVGAPETPPARDVAAYIDSVPEGSHPPLAEAYPPSEDEAAEIRPAGLFDYALGLLAELGDEVETADWRRICEGVLGVSEDVFRAVGRRAQRAGLVERDGDLISFTDATFAEQLREATLELESYDAEIRRALGDVLLDPVTEASREQIDLAVDHLLQAGELARSIEVLNRAGNQAFSMLDLDAAREFYLRLQRIFERTDDAALADAREAIEADPARIWLRIGEIHGALGEHGAAEDALERAAEHPDARSAGTRGRALKLLGDIQFDHKRYDAALLRYARARGTFYESGEPSHAASAASLVGATMHEQGKFEEARSTFRETLEDVEPLDLPLVRARTHMRLGRTALRLGDFDPAFRHLDEAATAFEELDRPDEAMLARSKLGEAAFAVRDFELARDNHRIARRRAESVQRFDEVYPTLGLCRSYAALGEFDEAWECLDDEDAPDRKTRLPEQHVLWAMHRADLRFAGEAFEEALQYYEQAGELAGRVGRTDLVLSVLLRRAFLSFHGADFDAAEELFKEATDRARRYGDRERFVIARTSAMYLDASYRDFPPTNEPIADQLEKTQSNDLTWARAVCGMYLADVRASNGLWSPVRELLRPAERWAAQTGRPRLLSRLGHRRARARAIEEDRTPPTIQGTIVGGSLPPEIRDLRADVIYSPP